MTDLKILALDTSTTPCCAALLAASEGTTLEGCASLEEPRDLSSQLMRLIDDALQGASWTLDDVHLLAVGLGPGSWTGLRIGISAFKTLAQARELPLYGVSTFEALHRSVSGDSQKLVGVVAPSRPGEIYGLVAQGRSGEAVKLWTPQAFAQALTSHEELTSVPFIVGTDEATCEVVAASVSDIGACNPQIEMPTPQRVTHAVGEIAVKRHTEGRQEDGLRVEPLYLAPSNAERARAAKLAAKV